MNANVTTAEQEQAQRALEQYGSKVQAARALGIHRETLSRRLRGPKEGRGRAAVCDAEAMPRKGITTALNDAEGSGVVTAVSNTIRTLEAALAAAKVDTKVWEVERHVVNKWDMGANIKDQLTAMELWQVKVWLRRRSPIAPDVMIEALIERLKKSAPAYPKLPKPRVGNGRFMAEPCLFDMHFGKLGWGPEVGENYDTKIAKMRFQAAVLSMVEKMQKYPIEKILMPLGNDLMHANNSLGETEKGTRLDVDSRIQKAYLETFDVVTWAIEMFMQVAPVEVVEVKGNHDPLLTFTICHALSQRFHRTDRVEIDLSPATRKYKIYGVTLLGYTHGDSEKQATLPQLMAIEAPQEFAGAKVREWHIGHFHKKKEDRYNAGDTHQGVRVRVIPTLSGTDAWHAKKGYVKQPQEAELFIWNHDEGLETMFPIRANVG